MIVLAAVGVFFWIRSSHYATTDDAQLDGNIYAVRSSVTAFLDSIYFQDNQQVEKGDTLLVFDTKALKAKVKKAKAALEKAQTKLSVSDIQALVSRQSAAASHQSALSGQEHIALTKAKYMQAKQNFERDEKLLAINGITQKQYDADQSALKQAKAIYQQALHQQKSSFNISQSRSAKAKAAHQQISTALAEVEQCKAELALARENLNHAYVLAPCNGIVAKRAVNPGQYVLAGQSLCSITDENRLWVTANFKETALNEIKPGQKVKISIDAYPDLKLTGTVESFGGATGSKYALIPPDNATGNFIKVTQRFPLRISLDPFSQSDKIPNGRNKSGFVLFPGLSVFVKVKIN